MRYQSEVKILRVRGEPYYGQVYQAEGDPYFGMVWDDYDVNILQTHGFPDPEQVWENMREALQRALLAGDEQVEGWTVPNP